MRAFTLLLSVLLVFFMVVVGCDCQVKRELQDLRERPLSDLRRPNFLGLEIAWRRWEHAARACKRRCGDAWVIEIDPLPGDGGHLGRYARLDESYGCDCGRGRLGADGAQ